VHVDEAGADREPGHVEPLGGLGAAQIAQRDKYTLVIRSEAVVWPIQSELDITNEVIRKTNEMK